MDYRPGIVLLIVVVTTLLTAIAAVDFYFQVRRWRSLGRRLQGWAAAYPIFATGLVLVLGALLGHFFWQP